MTIWKFLRPLEIFNGRLEYFVVIWSIFPRFGMLYQEKSGNPGAAACRGRQGKQISFPDLNLDLGRVSENFMKIE
jgi:hypothetical protein